MCCQWDEPISTAHLPLKSNAVKHLETVSPMQKSLSARVTYGRSHLPGATLVPYDVGSGIPGYSKLRVGIQVKNFAKCLALIGFSSRDRPIDSIARTRSREQRRMRPASSRV